ncbi:MAG: DUF1538 domain-containing protein [bacterium]|jgi:hypothetical protein
MFDVFRSRLLEVIRAVAPLIAAVIVLQIAFVGASVALFLRFLVGAALAIVGMLLLFTGVDLGILPMGRFVGAELPKKGSMVLILAVGFLLGLATTVAEPDVLVLSSQVETASQGAVGGWSLVYAIAVGVGLFAALALLRIVWGFPMTVLLAGAYSLIVLLSFFSPVEFVPLAYDAGSVTTGVLTAPVLLALTLGLSSVLGNRSAVADGFGLLGLASIGPIIVLLVLGMLLS